MTGLARLLLAFSLSSCPFSCGMVLEGVSWCGGWGAGPGGGRRAGTAPHASQLGEGHGGGTELISVHTYTGTAQGEGEGEGVRKGEEGEGGERREVSPCTPM